MFDIGFWELTIIGVVALIVIGPEKLPAVARTMGYWFGKTQRFVATVKEDINREVSKTEELKRLIEEQSKIKEMHEIIEHSIDDTKKSVSIGAPIQQPKSMDDTTADKQSSSETSAPNQSRTTDQINEQAK